MDVNYNIFISLYIQVLFSMIPIGQKVYFHNEETQQVRCIPTPVREERSSSVGEGIQKRLTSEIQVKFGARSFLHAVGDSDRIYSEEEIEDLERASIGLNQRIWANFSLEPFRREIKDFCRRYRCIPNVATQIQQFFQEDTKTREAVKTFVLREGFYSPVANERQEKQRSKIDAKIQSILVRVRVLRGDNGFNGEINRAHASGDQAEFENLKREYAGYGGATFNPDKDCVSSAEGSERIEYQVAEDSELYKLQSKYKTVESDDLKEALALDSFWRNYLNGTVDYLGRFSED